MCPICAVSSSSEANRVVRDLPQHILATHKKPVVDMVGGMGWWCSANGGRGRGKGGEVKW